MTTALVQREIGVRPQLERVDVPEPQGTEVLVRMVASGVCGSDLHAIHGVSSETTVPQILGHEGSGVVEAVGPDVTTHRVGDSVVLTSLVPCYQCANCLRGYFYFCTDRPARPASRITVGGETLHTYAGIGSLSEHVLIPAGGAVRVPADSDLELLALTGCAALTGLGAVFNMERPPAGGTAAVIGCGGVGLSVVHGLQLCGTSRIIAVDVAAPRLATAETLGATDLVDAGALGGSIDAAVRELVPEGVDVAYEVVGDPDLVLAALLSTRPGGTCVTLGAARPDTEIRIPSRLLMMSERRLVGCLFGHSLPQRDIPRIVELHRSGRFRLDELATQRLPFAEWEKAVELSEQGQAARCLLTFG